MKRILIPCDFSEGSREALRFAHSFAAYTDSELTVLHVLYLPTVLMPGLSDTGPVGYYEEYCRNLDEHSHQKFEELKNAAGLFNVQLEFKVVYGDVVGSIISESIFMDADYIVMGASGDTGWVKKFLGSTTQKVVQLSRIPVFVIHQSVEVGSIRKILLPSDLTLDQGEYINSVKDLQRGLNATLHVLLVCTPSQFFSSSEASKALNQFIKHYQLENVVPHFVNHETEEAGITEFALSENVDMIVMGTHSRRGLAHLISGSVTDEVLDKIDCPILTYSLRHHRFAPEGQQQELYEFTE